MILLRDVVEIEATPEQVFDWLAHFEENFLAWHPDHVECRYLKGTHLFDVNSVLYVEEYLHGKLHKLKFRGTKVIPNRRVEYKAGFGLGGAFEVVPHGDKVLFIAEITLGSSFPVLGRLLDAFLKNLLSDNLRMIKQHMTEEGENLKRLLEEGAGCLNAGERYISPLAANGIADFKVSELG